MTCINLLPWREELREHRKRKFGFWSGGVTLIVILLFFVMHSMMNYWLERQYQRNTYLNDQIIILNRHNAEILNLKKQKKMLSQKVSLIQSLQANRPLAVHVLDELVNVLPSGIYLKRLDWNNRRIKMLGLAEANSYISSFMRQIEKSDWLAHPELIEIKSDKDPNISEQLFRLMVRIRDNEKEA